MSKIIDTELIEKEKIDILANSALGCIQEFFKDEKNQKEFEEWMERRREKVSA